MKLVDLILNKHKFEKKIRLSGFLLIANLERKPMTSFHPKTVLNKKLFLMGLKSLNKATLI
jgi:hypothetical protein